MPVSRGMSGVAGRKNSLNDNNPHPFVRHMKRTSTVFDQHHKLHCNLESRYKDMTETVWVCATACEKRKARIIEKIRLVWVLGWCMSLICPMLVFNVMELSVLGGGFWVAALSCSVVVNHLLIRTIGDALALAHLTQSLTFRTGNSLAVYRRWTTACEK